MVLRVEHVIRYQVPIYTQARVADLQLSTASGDDIHGTKLSEFID